MIARQILRSVLLIVVLGCLAIWANHFYLRCQAAAPPPPPAAATVPVVAGHQVVMTYFISGERCESCKTIEALARHTAEQDFPAALAGGRLVFRVIDTGVPADHHFIDDYRLSAKTVILSHRVNGKETEWSDMSKVWDLLDDRPGFHAYLVRQIRSYLSS